MAVFILTGTFFQVIKVIILLAENLKTKSKHLQKKNNLFPKYDPDAIPLSLWKV